MCPGWQASLQIEGVPGNQNSEPVPCGGGIVWLGEPGCSYLYRQICVERERGCKTMLAGCVGTKQSVHKCLKPSQAMHERCSRTCFPEVG